MTGKQITILTYVCAGAAALAGNMIVRSISDKKAMKIARENTIDYAKTLANKRAKTNELYKGKFGFKNTYNRMSNLDLSEYQTDFYKKHNRK